MHSIKGDNIWVIVGGLIISRLKSLGLGNIEAINRVDRVDKTLNYIDNIHDSLIFTNLIDFDMLFGHRNDPRFMKSK